jgi:alpha-beta hydrolase superfamily lysophospholipase
MAVVENVLQNYNALKPGHRLQSITVTMASKLSANGYVPSSDSKLYYEIEGNPDGPTILFIHGLGGTTNAYQPIAPELQDFNIVRFDWGGHGRSSTPKTTSIESYVGDCEGTSTVSPG